MPCVVGHGERVTGIGRKRHLRFLWFASVRQHLVKDRADVRRGIVRWQIKLDRNPFPKTVRVFEDTISGNVTCQDRHRIHVHLAKFSPNRPFSPGANRWTKADCNSFDRNTRPAASQTARFPGGKWRMYSGKRSILARVGFLSGLLLPILLLPDIAR